MNSLWRYKGLETEKLVHSSLGGGWAGQVKVACRAGGGVEA